MKTMRARIGLAFAAVALLVVGAWYQQRTMLCEDALQRRRSNINFTTVVQRDALHEAEADVGRYCFTWVGR